MSPVFLSFSKVNMGDTGNLYVIFRNMDLRKEHDSKALAGQLRQPEGSLGIKVGENMNKGNRLMNLETIKQLEITDNDDILEIGMGNGFFVKDVIASAKNVKYTGCDFSDTMIKEATDLNNTLSENAAFILTDASRLPFIDASFDKVFTVNTIYFWGDAAPILNEVKRVLKPGGMFIVTLRPKHVMDQLPVVKHGFTTFTRDEVVNLLSENSFETVYDATSEDTEIKFDDKSIKNAFLVIKARKI
jgi:ubiquinone/menaquinone biosynthesis C-methylase UbiE